MTRDTYKGNIYQPWTQNLYTYCNNNPINYVDPTGHFPVDISDDDDVDAYDLNSDPLLGQDDSSASSTLVSKAKEFNHQIQSTIKTINTASSDIAIAATGGAIVSGISAVSDGPIGVGGALLFGGVAEGAGIVNVASSTSIYLDNPTPENQAKLEISAVSLIPGMAVGRIGERMGVSAAGSALSSNIIGGAGSVFDVFSQVFEP